MRLPDVLAVPFALIRLPLYVVDRSLLRRLNRHSGPRIALECGLGTVDICAGHFLADDVITGQGVCRVRAALRDRPAASSRSVAAVRAAALV